MCGISVIVGGSENNVRQKLVKDMNDRVNHRGPDDEGFFLGENFAFGHRRLSILDLSAAGHQPMTRRDLTLTYNGEIYNYIELREELKAFGHSFSSGSDTEVILSAYAQWGVDCFSRFNGMWAFAIADASRNELILSRDHFGIKPLYFTQTESYFLAGSEIKQFTAVSEFKAVLNRPVAVNFLTRGLLNYSEETFFKGVNELRPGHYLKYDLSTSKIEIQQWYNLNAASKKVNDNFETAVGKVRELFIDSVKIRMRSDVTVGSCLSGGIDSSSIVGIIHGDKMANADFSTITSCYSDKRYDEQRFSDEITLSTGFKSLKVYPDLNHLIDEGDMDKMLYHQDQPFGSASHYSEFKVFQKARENRMIVMQDGQGSDEYLCGYGEFFIVRMKELIRSVHWGEAYSLLKNKAAHKQTTVTAELKSFIKTAYFFRALNFLKRISGRSQYPWLSNEWRTIARSAKVELKENDIRNLSITEIEQSSIPYQLHSEDRNSMLFSIESRLPFLDHRLVEYVIGLPSSYKIRDGYTKAVLRDAIYELPESIRTRKDKMGFVAPDEVWIKENKEKVRQDLLNIVKTTGIFSDELLKRFDRFIDGTLGYEPIYFRAMTLSRFCKIFGIA
ncbi:MAG: asparagine synthase (glutamine-hydrolyzing) [Cyclobacteriaceae bacterium]|nr:asparagine synthase (glutamine-hydrolyzing) [Cyclobacteriaceae bacterium]